MSNFISRFFIFATCLLVIHSAFAADVSEHDVYRAAQSGHVREALAMMDQVLNAHPNSARAHYVEAELLAKNGQLDKARAEFSRARELKPAMDFAKPAAVQALQAQLYPSNLLESDNVTRSRGISLTPFLFIGLLILSVIFFVRARQRAAMQNALYNNTPPPAYGAGYGPGYGPGYPPPTGGGLGSGILGGLATGAALGAGMVAGEALANRIMDGGENHHAFNDSHTDMHPDVNQDMGGNDFGLNDSSSWDDGGGADFGGDIGGGDWS